MGVLPALYVCTLRVCPVLLETKRGYQISRTIVTVVSGGVDVANQTMVFWKSNKYSKLLSHLNPIIVGSFDWQSPRTNEISMQHVVIGDFLIFEENLLESFVLPWEKSSVD